MKIQISLLEDEQKNDNFCIGKGGFTGSFINLKKVFCMDFSSLYRDYPLRDFDCRQGILRPREKGSIDREKYDRFFGNYNEQTDNTQFLLNWEWFETEREKYEEQTNQSILALADELYGHIMDEELNQQRKIVMIQGKAGHGKTAFIKYFIHNYLTKKEKYARIAVARISMQSFSPELSLEDDVFNNNLLNERFETEFDIRISSFLKDTFFTLFNTEDKKIEIVNTLCNTEIEHEGSYFSWLTSDVNDVQLNTNELKLKWINNFLGSKDYSRINRFIMDYLSIKYGFKFIFFIDNIDQTSSSQQYKLLQTIRHKLEYVLYKRNIIYVLTVRDYLTQRYQQLNSANTSFRPIINVLPPNPSKLIEKRLKFIKKINEYSQNNLPATVNFFEQGSMEFTLKDPYSIFSLYAHAIKENVCINYLLKINNYNIRSLLLGIKTMMESKLVTINEYEQICNLISRSEINSHEVRLIFNEKAVLQKLLCVEHIIYDTNKSTIFNIFCYKLELACPRITLLIFLVIKYLYINPGTMLENIVNEFVKLGYSQVSTRDCIFFLLNCSILYAHEGIRQSDNIGKLFIHRVPAIIYTENISTKLMYIQNMAFFTPLDYDLYEEGLPIIGKLDPENFYGIKSLNDRMTIASLLFRQIKRDEIICKQIATEAGFNISNYNYNEFFDISNNIYKSISNEINNIGQSYLLELFNKD